MKRRFLTVAVLTAFLVGCAASAMHYGPPAAAVAQNAGGHAHSDTVTGPCYKPTGGDCASTYHFVHGQITLTTGTAACAVNSQCGFTSYETLTGSAIFANTNYDCHAFGLPTTTGVAGNVVMQAFPLGTSTVDFGFRNLTGMPIPASTSFSINFTCDGA
jgi:hypothetical protein